MSVTKTSASLPKVSGGQYKILRQIGEGGMAVVYEVVELASDRRVALKMLRPKFRDNLDFRKRFSLEAKTGARLQHANHVTVYSSHLDADGEVDYYTMELLEGMSLDRELVHRRLVDWPFAVELARQVCEGVSELDRLGIIHRDIKPGNIYLSPLRGPGAENAAFPYTVKLLDLGICKISGDSNLSGTTHLKTREGVVIGTFLYMAPEIFRGEKPTASVDIYAIGVLLYRLLTGKHPIEGGPEFEVRVCTEMPAAPSSCELLAPIPGVLDDLILQSLEKNPAARPESASVVGEELTACLALTGQDRTRLRTPLFYVSIFVLYACFFVSVILLSSLLFSDSGGEPTPTWAPASALSAGTGGVDPGDGGTTTSTTTMSTTTTTSSTSETTSLSTSTTGTIPDPSSGALELSRRSIRTRTGTPTSRPQRTSVDCSSTLAEIQAAREKGLWDLLLGILDKRGTKECLKLRRLRKLRTLAYKETLQFGLCAKEGGKVRGDDEIKGWVNLCLSRNALLPAKSK